MSDSEPRLTTAAASGTRLEALEALRDLLASQIVGCESSRDVAALSQRLMDVLAQVDTLSAGAKAKGTALDELAERRKAAKRPAARASRAKVKP